MKVLVACEESQAVTIEFRKLGHEAYSCDIVPCSGGHPEWHLQQDVLSLLSEFWDMMIAFPPCTHLSVSGARWFKDKQEEQQEAINFFLSLVHAKIPKIAIENPVGIMSTHYRTPDQYIQPYQFGHLESKKTCLWFKDLPLLKETNNVYKEMMLLPKNKRERIHNMSPSKDRAKIRSKTFPGIAKAMAEQWS